MATLTGKLAQSKPAATTNTVLYRAPIDAAASGVLNMVNDGTASTVRVGVKGYDLSLTLDASTYKLHRGDVITNKVLTFDTAIPITTNQQDTFSPGQKITSDDGEKSFKWESYYVPPSTDYYVKEVTLTSYTLENQTGTYQIGETVSFGGVSAVIFDIIPGSFGGSTLYLGPRTGGSFAEGDTLTGGTSGASADIATGGIGTARASWVFSDSGAGGTYALRRSNRLELFLDRVYTFYVSDSSMTGNGFALSTTINGTWGIDGLSGTSDDGQEYTTGKTTNGTPGQAGAYVRYDLSQNGGGNATYYYYDSSNANIGGLDQAIDLSIDYAYDAIYVYDVVGTWTNSSDSITLGSTTFTVTGQSGSKWAYVQSYSGTNLKVTTGLNSAAFAATDTFYDVPTYGTSSVDRTLATVSAVVTGAADIASDEWIVYNKNITADTRLTSLVVGPGQALVVYSTTANVIFDYSGFQDSSSDITLRSYDASAGPVVGASGG